MMYCVVQALYAVMAHGLGASSTVLVLGAFGGRCNLIDDFENPMHDEIENVSTKVGLN